MSIQIPSDIEILHEATEVLLEHLGPAKSARFWSIWQAGQGDYLRWRDTVFGQMSVAELYEQIAEYQAQSPTQAPKPDS